MRKKAVKFKSIAAFCLVLKNVTPERSNEWKRQKKST